MADIFDQLAQAQPAAPGGSGDVFDQIHTQAIQQPQGSAMGRAAQGAWEYTGGGIWDLVKGLTSLAIQGAKPGVIDPSSAGGKLIQGVVQGHIDQAAKAKDAMDRGNYVEAFGHTLAAALPLLGPAAANIGQTAGGSAPQYDKYGNVLQPGQAPDIPRAIGQAAGLGVSLATPSLLKGKAAAPAAAADTASVSKLNPGLNPVQQAAVDYLQANNVPLNVGTITGNKFAKAAQIVVQNSPLGAQTGAEAGQATEAGLTRVAGELADQAYPSVVTPEMAGKTVVKALQQKVQDLQLPENEGYEQAWQGRDKPQFTYNMPVRTVRTPVLDATGSPTGEFQEAPPVKKQVNMPVDVRDIKDQLQSVFQEMQWMPAADRASSAGYQAVKNILEGDDFIPAWQAEKGLSGLKTMARTDNVSGVRNASQGIGAQIIPQLQEGINGAVAFTGDDALRGLQQGRAMHATKMEVADLADQLRTEPVQAFNQLTYGRDAGIDFLRKIADQTPDSMPKIGRAYVDQLFDQATREGGFGRAQTILKQWQQLGPETKALLYPNPALRAGLDNFFKGAQMVGENPNPSGTAVVTQATQLNPLRWMAGYVGSKLLFSPRGVALLTKSLRAGAPSALMAQIRDLAGTPGGAPAVASAGQAAQSQ